MLSYLHAFHAGNHADILKHAALIQLIKKLNEKPAPYSFFDTHAGSGLYSTQGEKARKTGEAERGVLALAEYADKEAAQDLNGGSQQETDASQRSGGGLPTALADYLNFVRPYLARDLYPGSPLIERALLRGDCPHTICELHPAEYESLKENCARNFGLATDTGAKTKNGPHTQILKQDGFKSLLALTPPKTKRGAALIDPSYEEASDYEAVSKTVIAVHKKWSAGIIMVWFPLLAHRAAEIEKMIESISAAAKIQNANTNILQARFCVDAQGSHTEMPLKENAAANAAANTAPRLYGSGVLVLNSPWKLDEELEAALKFLARVPGLASAPSYSVELS